MKFSLVLLCLLGSLALCHADAVRLQINGPDGKPVAGAQVRVVESKGMWFRRQDLPSHDFVSDANGVVALQSQNPLGNNTLDETKSTLMARVLSPGMAVGIFGLKAGDNTFALKVGKTLEGVAVGDDEKPTANAHLFISSLSTKGPRYDDLPDALALEATSDAQGHWKFDALPLEGQATIEVRDARFKRESFPVDVAQKTPPLFLSAGMTIKGRLLRPDGSGAPGIRIYAGDYEHQPVTDATGRFEASGLADSSVMLQIVGNDQKVPFIVNYKSVEGLKPGEVRDIGDWKTTKGVKLKGLVVNSATKKPIADASVSTWGRGANTDARSDKTGAFELLVSPDSSNVSVNASGFVPLSLMDVPDAQNGVIDIGILALRAGQKVSGVVVDEMGNAVTGISLFASRNNGNRSYGRTNLNDGAFFFDGLEAGNYTIKSDRFTLVSGATFSVGTGKAPTLRVVLKGKVGQTGQQSSHTIEGLVVDGEGHPLAGAKIALRIQETNGSYSSPTVVSQTDGSFKTSTTMSGAILRVVSINRPGFARGQEKIEQKDSNWRVDLTLQKRGEALRGHVVDAEGRPIAGAYVGLQNGTDLPVATDEKGAFALLDVPLSGVTLFASNGPSLATFAVKQGVPVEISLPAVLPLEDKAALADQILPQARLGYNWKERWDALGQKRIEEAFLLRKGNGWSWSWKEYLQELARREPQTLLTHEVELRAQTPADVLPDLDRLAMLARASSTDAALQNKARVWLRAQEKEKRDISSGTVTRLLGLAQIGARLNAQEGQMWLDYATQIAEQLDAKRAGENSWEWGNMVAGIGPDAVETLSESWSSTARMQLFVTAMSAWAADKNLAAARKGWEKMQELALDAAQHPDPQVKVEGFRQKPADLLNQGRNYYLQLLARTDPKAALALAAPLDEFQKTEALLAVAREAVKQKQFDVARAALPAVFEIRLGNPEFAAYAAGLAQKFDADYAAQLWPKAYAKARPRDEDESRGWQPSIAAYAEERAAKWPGESRILIEREWAKRLAQSAKPDAHDGDFDSDGRAMQSLATAMARLNPRRALEMAEQITDKEDLRAETRGTIAATLLTK
ncbi:hypothetical protein IAD21_01126 [Abditibacteriota bacterium]|nr:hypothetical protein IAD21_01126 [Abditibacteriota bacterium]